MVQQQLVDIGLRHRRLAGALADPHPPRLAPRQFEHLVADQIIVEDDGGVLQRPQSAQCKMRRVARAGADEQDLGGRQAAAAFGQDRGIVAVPRRDGGTNRAIGERSPECAPGSEFADILLQPPAPFARRRRPTGQPRPDQSLDPLAQPLAEHRRGAAGANADHHRRAVDDRAEDEVRSLGLVDHIDRHAARPRRHGQRRAFGPAGTDRQRHPGEVGLGPLARPDVEPLGRDRIQPGAEPAHIGAGGEQQVDFPPHRIALPDDHHRPTGEPVEQRQRVERRDRAR